MDPSLSQILGFITGGGFAVFVAVWFLIRLEARLSELKDAIHQLELAIQGSKRPDNAPGAAVMGGRERLEHYRKE